MTIIKALAALALTVPLAALALTSHGPKSGLAIGEMVSAFEPTHVTGPDAGTSTCPVCKYGMLPAVQVWVNGDKLENVAKIADTLEGAIKMEGADKLKAFIVFIKPQNESVDETKAQLSMVAAKCNLHNVGLLYVDGPKSSAVEEYKINTDASVKNTVIVYHKRTVDANFVNLKGNEAGIKSLKGAMMKACGM